jgi:hypothetical protein
MDLRFRDDIEQTIKARVLEQGTVDQMTAPVPETGYTATGLSTTGSTSTRRLAAPPSDRRARHVVTPPRHPS